MIWAEEKVSVDGITIAHHHVLVEQGRLSHRVHKNLEEDGVRI